MQLFLHAFVLFPHRTVLSQFKTNLTSIKAKTKQVLSNLSLLNVFLSPHPLVHSAMIQISPSLLFTAMYLQKPFLLLSLARDSFTGTWLSKPHLCMFRPCVYIPSKSPVLSFNSSLHLACKLQQLLIHSCKLPLLQRIMSSRASLFTDSLTISVWTCCIIVSCCVILPADLRVIFFLRNTTLLKQVL